ncbi:MAG: zinc dependent phospholipase C family protein [Candidatus Promineifilaceae bacterium]
MAERILDDGRLDPQVRLLLEEQLPAYYLGNVAPDYQTISSIPREKTHFYDLPPNLSDDACLTMLTQYPELSAARASSQAQATFISAYCSHLLLDLRWYHDILIPFFLGPSDWKDHRHRFIVHNTLLTYLDKQALYSLPESAAETLEAAKPNGWLPFASNSDLLAWRDFLVSQMRPGATPQTVEIFAGRLSMSPEQFSENLDRPEWMEEHVFTKVSLDSVLAILTTAIGDGIDLICDYFQVIQ